MWPNCASPTLTLHSCSPCAAHGVASSIPLPSLPSSLFTPSFPPTITTTIQSTFLPLIQSRPRGIMSLLHRSSASSTATRPSYRATYQSRLSPSVATSSSSPAPRTTSSQHSLALLSSIPSPKRGATGQPSPPLVAGAPSERWAAPYTSLAGSVPTTEPTSLVPWRSGTYRRKKEVGVNGSG